MNEPFSKAPAGVVPGLPTPYKDRKAGLVVFGIFTILLGCLAGLVVLLMGVGLAAAEKTPEAQPPIPPMMAFLPGFVIYGALAVALVWLGIGSIKARRWARALLLIFSWSWLGSGLLGMAIMAFLLPTLRASMNASIAASMAANGTAGQPAPPPAAIGVMLVVMLLFWGVLFVILPAVWTFFYHSRHVKATCQARDPVRRWTDTCPLPVLGFSLWLAVSVPMMLLMPLAGHGVIPFFGMFLSGLPGSLFCLVLAGLWGAAAWWLYKLEPRGWWLMFIALLVFGTSGLLTFAQHDLTDMYGQMGYTAAQIEPLKATGMMTGKWMSWAMGLIMVPFLIYLLWIKKFFRRPA